MNNKLQVLEKVLGSLQKAGIEARDIYFTRYIYFHNGDIECDIESVRLFPKISLIRNDNFEVEYNVQTKEIRFGTTYSNLTIDDNFVNQMLEIHKMLPLMKEAMDYIFTD